MAENLKTLIKKWNGMVAPHHAFVNMQPITACFHDFKNVNTYAYQNLIPNLLLILTYIFSFLILFYSIFSLFIFLVCLKINSIIASIYIISIFIETLDAFYININVNFTEVK